MNTIIPEPIRLPRRFVATILHSAQPLQLRQLICECVGFAQIIHAAVDIAGDRLVINFIRLVAFGCAIFARLTFLASFANF